MCWHPDLGYLRFNSYSTVTPSSGPGGATLFTRRPNAEMRLTVPFYHGQKSYPGETLTVRLVRFSWQTVPETT